MRGKITFVTGMIFLSLYFGGTGKIQAAPSINTGSLHLWINQHALGAVPNLNAAFFKFFNQDNNPVGTVISPQNSICFDPENVVELAPDQAAFGSVSGIFFITDHCEKQDVREVIDFESPQCQVPEGADPDATLNAILSLPEECMGPQLDACKLFNENPNLGFATSMPQVRQILENEIDIQLILDGVALAPLVNIKPVQFAVSDFPDSQPNPLFDCSEVLHYSPIDMYFFNAYRIPSPHGKCMVMGITAPVTPLDPGPHQLVFDSNYLGDQQSCPVNIIQKAP